MIKHTEFEAAPAASIAGHVGPLGTEPYVRAFYSSIDIIGIKEYTSIANGNRPYDGRIGMRVRYDDMKNDPI